MTGTGQSSLTPYPHPYPSQPVRISSSLRSEERARSSLFSSQEIAAWWETHSRSKAKAQTGIAVKRFHSISPRIEDEELLFLALGEFACDGLDSRWFTEAVARERMSLIREQLAQDAKGQFERNARSVRDDLVVLANELRARNLPLGILEPLTQSPQRARSRRVRCARCGAMWWIAEAGGEDHVCYVPLRQYERPETMSRLGLGAGRDRR